MQWPRTRSQPASPPITSSLQTALSDCNIPLSLDAFTRKIQRFQNRARKRKQRTPPLPSLTIADVLTQAAAFSSGNKAGPSSNPKSKSNGKDQGKSKAKSKAKNTAKGNIKGGKGKGGKGKGGKKGKGNKKKKKKK